MTLLTRGINQTRREFLCVCGATTAVVLGACSADKQDAVPAAEPVGANTPEQLEPEAPETPQTAESEDAPMSSNTNVLVAYYSRAGENYAGGGTEWLEVGHTKVMAGYIAEALGADEYEIVPAAPYPDDYQECCDVAAAEQNENARPEIAHALPDMSFYDTIFIGCPIWWGDEPMIVRTFVEGVDLSGKKIAIFTMHGGSGLGAVPRNLQQLIPGATFTEAKAVAGTAAVNSKDEIVAWAQSSV